MLDDEKIWFYFQTIFLGTYKLTVSLICACPIKWTW